MGRLAAIAGLLLALLAVAAVATTGNARTKAVTRKRAAPVSASFGVVWETARCHLPPRVFDWAWHPRGSQTRSDAARNDRVDVCFMSLCLLCRRSCFATCA
jgi:hypothetical protein